MCWRQLCDVSDGFGRFCHQHPLTVYISFRHLRPKDVTNIEIPSPTIVTNIYVAELLGLKNWHFLFEFSRSLLLFILDVFLTNYFMHLIIDKPQLPVC